MTGFVYAVECGQRVKIGYSEAPEKRFSKIATDSPFPCILLGYWPGTVADELDVQNKFHATRVHGEWFAVTEQILQFILDNTVIDAKMGKPNRVARNEIDAIILRLGAPSKASAALGIDNPSVVMNWRARGKVPANKVLEVEALTGISRHMLRPDIFGKAEATS